VAFFSGMTGHRGSVERGERASVDGVGVRGRDDVRAVLVDRAVDHEGAHSTAVREGAAGSFVDSMPDVPEVSQSAKQVLDRPPAVAASWKSIRRTKE
jgi:hypothetical protein